MDCVSGCYAKHYVRSFDQLLFNNPCKDICILDIKLYIILVEEIPRRDKDYAGIRIHKNVIHKFVKLLYHRGEMKGAMLCSQN